MSNDKSTSKEKKKYKFLTDRERQIKRHEYAVKKQYENVKSSLKENESSSLPPIVSLIEQMESTPLPYQPEKQSNADSLTKNEKKKKQKSKNPDSKFKKSKLKSISNQNEKQKSNQKKRKRNDNNNNNNDNNNNNSEIEIEKNQNETNDDKILIQSEKQEEEKKQEKSIPIDPEFALFKKRNESRLRKELNIDTNVKHDRYLKARKELAARQEEKLQKALKQEYDMMLSKRKARKRQNRRANMNRRTAKGQPIMSALVFDIVDKLQEEKKNDNKKRKR